MEGLDSVEHACCDCDLWVRTPMHGMRIIHRSCSRVACPLRPPGDMGLSVALFLLPTFLDYMDVD